MTEKIAIGWVLEASYATGGKEYRVMVYDKYVVVGWGSRTGSMQYKVHQEAHAAAAQEYALVLTTSKEKGGYVLTNGPKRAVSPYASWVVAIPKHYPQRGGSPFFDSAFGILMQEGVPL